MNDTTENRTQQEQDLLTAARALGAHQFSEIRARRELATAELNKTTTATLLEEAERELAEADAVYANAKVHHLACASRQKTFGNDLHIYLATSQTREHLWAVSSSTDDAVIIAAALAYGEASRLYWERSQAKQQADSEHESAKEALRLAAEARKVAVQKRGRAKAAFEEAEQELARCQRGVPYESGGFFALESAVTDAAHALTGTTDKQYAYSYVYTKDLPIALPEDSPSEADGQ